MMHKGERRVSLCVDALVVDKGTFPFACDTDRAAIAKDVTYENVETDCMNHKIRARRMLSLKMMMARMGQDKHGQLTMVAVLENRNRGEWSMENGKYSA